MAPTVTANSPDHGQGQMVHARLDDLNDGSEFIKKSKGQRIAELDKQIAELQGLFRLWDHQARQNVGIEEGDDIFTEAAMDDVIEDAIGTYPHLFSTLHSQSWGLI